MSFPREQWRFARAANEFDPYNDARKCKRCGNRLFSVGGMDWTPNVQSGTARCWRCPGSVCQHDDTSVQSCPKCTGRCRNCDNVTDRDCVRCFGCYFCEAIRFRQCDNPGHHGKRAVPNTDGDYIRAFSPVKSQPQKRWHCFHCISANNPMLWKDYELSQVTQDGEIPSISGYQTVMLQHSLSFDPLAKLGGSEAVWPRRGYSSFFAIIVPLSVHVPDRNRKSYRVLRARVITGVKDSRLDYKVRPIDSDSIVLGLEPFCFMVPEVHSTPPFYYIVHCFNGILTIESHKRYLIALDSLMAMPWGENMTNTIVANYLDGRPYDGLS